MNNLTPKQQLVLDMIRQFKDNHDYSPTVSELSWLIGINKNAVWKHLHSLERKGYLKRDKRTARSIVLIEKESG